MPFRERSKRIEQRAIVLRWIVVHQHQIPREGLGIVRACEQFAIERKTLFDVAAIDQRSRANLDRRALERTQCVRSLAPRQRFARTSEPMQGRSQRERRLIVVRMALGTRPQQFRVLSQRARGREIRQNICKRRHGIEHARMARDVERTIRVVCTQMTSHERTSEQRVLGCFVHERSERSDRLARIRRLRKPQRGRKPIFERNREGRHASRYRSARVAVAGLSIADGPWLRIRHCDHGRRGRLAGM